jgi:hypothetical protein
MLDLEPIKARDAARTPGSWKNTGDPKSAWENSVSDENGGYVVHTGAEGDGGCAFYEDAEFIASAATDVPALIAEVEWLRKCMGLIHQINCKHEQASFVRMLDHDRQVFRCDACGFEHFCMVDPVTGDILNVAVTT